MNKLAELDALYEAATEGTEMSIRCAIGNHLVPRYPCPIHKPHRRDKQVALAVIARDKRCWKCGTTERLEAGHIVAKADGGADSLSNLRAECWSLNRTGKCRVK